MNDQVLMTVEEAARRLRIGRSTAYALIQTGQIESIKIGASRRVPAAALSTFVDQLRGHEIESDSGESRRAIDD